MTRQSAIIKLQEQLEEVDALRKETPSSARFKQWIIEARTIIEQSFQDEPRIVNSFNEINFAPVALTRADPLVQQTLAYQRGLDSATAILSSLIKLLERGVLHSVATVETDLANVTKLLRRFPLVTRQLKKRHSRRTTLEISDEYDVQDLIHGLLWIEFDDIRAEEVTPSYAGGSSRVDFLIKSGKIVIEVKKTRDGLKDKDLGAQLIIDIKRYQTHPDCKYLVCFVYDPDHRVSNPKGIENDLSKKHDDLQVIVIIEPE